jgi:uncharacterized protein involved in exopolysaccharide biosynthesis
VVTSQGVGAPEPAEPPQYSLVDLGSMLARHRRATIGFPLLCAFLTGVVSLFVAPTYTATTTFVPEASAQGRLPAGLAGLATQFGISLGSEASKSPKFYAEVVRSRELMEHVLLSNYVDPRRKQPAATDSVTLLHILRVRGRDSADSLYRGVKKLNKLVSVTVNVATNIVTLNVDAHYPTLAAAVANRFVAYLNAFNAQSRQSQAREQRKFVEQRLAEGERELRGAEEDLRTFYERNRSWQPSPQLTFEEGRLRRQVEIRQELYLTLKREYETARIQEVNDTPVITVIDAAASPSKKSKPKRALLVVIALVLGAMLGASWAAGSEYVERARRPT